MAKLLDWVWLIGDEFWGKEVESDSEEKVYVDFFSKMG